MPKLIEIEVTFRDVLVVPDDVDIREIKNVMCEVIKQKMGGMTPYKANVFPFRPEAWDFTEHPYNGCKTIGEYWMDHQAKLKGGLHESTTH